jgi:5'-3' exonuclease
VVQYDRRKDEYIDESGVIAKFGVPPASIPDYLALVGDAADGFPGLPGWGPKSAGAVLAAYGHLESVPASGSDWNIPGLRGVDRLATTLQNQFDDALLFRRIATVVDTVEVGLVDDWCWSGPTAAFADAAAELGAPYLFDRAQALIARATRSPR